MKTFSSIEDFEIFSPKKYYDFIETADFRLVYDKTNPDAYDANNAVLKSLNNVEDSIRQVEIAHEAVCAIPQFRSAPDSITKHQAQNALTFHGYEFCDEQLFRLSCTPRISYKDLIINKCVCKALNVLQGDERALLISSCNGQDYCALMADKMLKAGGKIFVAYNDENQPVSICMCEGYADVMYISSVFTAPEYRCKGFATTLLCNALIYAKDKCYNIAYLYVDSDDAKNVYEKVGFANCEAVTFWKAFKGGVPKWLLHNK